MSNLQTSTEVTFKDFVADSIMYTDDYQEQLNIIKFASVGRGGLKKIAEEVTDLDDEQLDTGEYIIDNYSMYKADPDKYIEERLKKGIYGGRYV